MRNVVSYLLTSIDGVVGSPERWMGDHFDAEMGANLQSLIDNQDAVLLGRRTYELWVSYWPASKHEPFASFINGTAKHVVSTTLSEVSWSNSALVHGELRAAVSRLKDKPGKDVGVHGSPNLVRSLLRERLIDELRLAVVPVIAGSGQRLFDRDGEQQRMQLVGSRETSSGVVILRYQTST